MTGQIIVRYFIKKILGAKIGARADKIDNLEPVMLESFLLFNLYFWMGLWTSISHEIVQRLCLRLTNFMLCYIKLHQVTAVLPALGHNRVANEA